MKKYVLIAAGCFLTGWCVHLYTGTAAMRGFFGDGALAFLLTLSKSYMFGGDGHWIYLYDAGTPRDFQFLLNSLGLQAALALDIRDPQALKYIFNFWQFGLPGFLYLGLFALLARAGRIAWAVFPLLCWAVLSVPVEWNAVNSTRWAMPLFWAHLLLVLLAGNRVRPWPALAALGLGAAMLGGLYETVVLQAALCLGFGALIWRREKNAVPFLYGLAAVPGAIRALWSYLLEGGAATPDGAPHLVLLAHLGEAYFLFVAMSLLLPLGLLAARDRWRNGLWPYFGMMLGVVGMVMLTGNAPNVWPQIEMRYDYSLLSAALMALAAVWRLMGWRLDAVVAGPAAILGLLAGTLLWIAQIDGTQDWQACRAAYRSAKGDAPLIVDRAQARLFSPRDGLATLWSDTYGSCVWDWASPWADLLEAPEGKVRQWTQFTFWQDFRFIEKDGVPFLHTNNWTLVMPAIRESAADLPLKTPLYDLTPLYSRIGDGELFPRAECMGPRQFRPSWQDYLLSLSDAKRKAMFLCPRVSSGP